MENETRKPKGLIIALIIIIVILLGAVGYFVYDKYFADNEVTTNEETKLPLTNSVVVDIEKKIEGITLSNENYFYAQKTINNDDMSYTAKLWIAILYTKDIDYNILKEVSFTDSIGNVITGKELGDDEIAAVTASLKNLFGANEEFTSDIEKNSFVANVDGKIIVAITDDDGISSIVLTTKATKTEDTIKIYKKIGYVLNTSNNSDIKYSILSTDLEGKNIIAQLDKYDENETEYYTEQMNANLDKFDTYVFTFKLDTTGNYYFYSSEIVK